MDIKGVGQPQRGTQGQQVPSSHRAGAAPAPVPVPAQVSERQQGDIFLPSGNSQPRWVGVGTLGSAVSTDRPGALNKLVAAAANRFNTSA